MGTSHNHVIADGNSFWHFMKCWAECSRGLPISKNPDHMRKIFNRDKKNYAIPNISLRAEEVLSDRTKEAQIFKFLPHDLHEKESSAVDASIENSIKDDKDQQLEISTFHFSKAMIQNLKERAGAKTSFVALAAHFWRCVMEAREIPEKEPTVFLLLADCRSRVNPPLPCTYFGNCVCIGAAMTTIQQLLCEDICFAAALIDKLISSSASETQLNNMIDWLHENPCSGAQRFVSDIGSAFRYSVNVVGSARFPVYEIDHGWGRPVNVQAASISEIGAMVLFPGKDTETEDGGKSIDISTCLPRRHMETLKRILMIIPH